MCSKLGNVQTKISCIFDTVVIEEPSTKRAQQTYKVVAGDTVRQAAHDSNIETATPSEKLDGTCVLIEAWRGRPWLWARLDRKPNKAADKRFKKFQLTMRSNKHKDVTNGSGDGAVDTFIWNVGKDFKDVPEEWIPASGVPKVDGVPQPDSAGHIPGWVPVDPASRQHCWHLTTVDLDDGMALILQPKTAAESNEDDRHRATALEVRPVPLERFLGCTMELIGTCINANPYKLGTKQAPFHLLVRHGSIPFQTPPPIRYGGIKDWLENDSEGSVEGVVWHCDNTVLYKLHRHHMQLKWPVPSPRLLSIPVTVNVSGFNPPYGSLFNSLKQLDQQTFVSLCDVQYTEKK